MAKILASSGICEYPTRWSRVLSINSGSGLGLGANMSKSQQIWFEDGGWDPRPEPVPNFMHIYI